MNMPDTGECQRSVGRHEDTLTSRVTWDLLQLVGHRVIPPPPGDARRLLIREGAGERFR